MVGPREGVLEYMVDAAKFKSVREAADMQAELLAAVLPRFANAVVVPVPTIHSHVRRRGYDHTARLARRLARHIDGQYAPLLERRGNSVQHGAPRAQRLKQAAEAFAIHSPVDEHAQYLLVDDVTTTGASILEAAKVLKTAGARHIYAAVTTYQVLK